MYPNATNQDKVLYRGLSYEVCGLCFKTHNTLGRFRNEKQYGDALETLLKQAGISYKRELVLPSSFPGEKNIRNRIDFLIDDKIILDIKAKPIITKDDYYQMQRYLVSYNKQLGIIVNFRQKYLSPKRILRIDS